MSEKKKQARPDLLAKVLPIVVAAAAGGFLVWMTMRLGVAPSRPEPARATGARLDPLRTTPEQYDWAQQPEAAFPIPPYARFLNDAHIALDPGHIGQSEKNRGDNWKRGPTGLREAEANLRVALFLREFLVAAGAKVTMTRDKDVPRDISDEDDLADRAAIANQARVDVLVSIHHNASDKNPEANYSTVFYHADGSLSPASLCVARHLLTGINDALRLEKHVECGLWSDFQMYPTGFGLLRRLDGPGVLCESSFHTNPGEEERLRDPVYNRREAYGMFVGLARWAQAGLPRVALLDPPDGRVRPGDTITLQLDDGLSRRDGKGVRAAKMMRDSLVVELDGHRLAYVVNPAKGTAQVTIPVDYDGPVTPLSAGPPGDAVSAALAAFPPPKSSKKETRPARSGNRTPARSPPRPAAARPGGKQRLFVNFQNIFGQHALHPWLEISILPPDSR